MPSLRRERARILIAATVALVAAVWLASLVDDLRRPVLLVAAAGVALVAYPRALYPGPAAAFSDGVLVIGRLTIRHRPFDRVSIEARDIREVGWERRVDAAQSWLVPSTSIPRVVVYVKYELKGVPRRVEFTSSEGAASAFVEAVREAVAE